MITVAIQLLGIVKLFLGKFRAVASARQTSTDVSLVRWSQLLFAVPRSQTFGYCGFRKRSV